MTTPSPLTLIIGGGLVYGALLLFAFARTAKPTICPHCDGKSDGGMCDECKARRDEEEADLVSRQ